MSENIHKHKQGKIRVKSHLNVFFCHIDDKRLSLCSKADTGMYIYQQAYLAKCHVCACLYYPHTFFSTSLHIKLLISLKVYTGGRGDIKTWQVPWISFICMSLKPKWHLAPLSRHVIDVVSQERTLRRRNLHPHSGLKGAAESVRGTRWIFHLAVIALRWDEHTQTCVKCHTANAIVSHCQNFLGRKKPV